jgi:Spy/CpxP family protein refolding chaperone
MNRLKNALIAGGCAVVLALGTNSVMAQGRGNFDPAEFRQRMMDDLRDAMEIKDDAEWTAIEPKVGKVFDARRDVMASVMRGGMRGMRRNNNGGNGGNGGNNGDDNNNGGQRRNRGGFFGEPSAAVTALQKAVDDKAPTAEIKAKLKAVQDEQKDKQAKLVAAQEDLRTVLTPRQEAVATLRGLL